MTCIRSYAERPECGDHVVEDEAENPIPVSCSTWAAVVYLSAWKTFLRRCLDFLQISYGIVNHLLDYAGYGLCVDTFVAVPV
jgi:hypothetical protein